MAVRIFKRVWDHFTEPPQSIREAQEWRHAQLLSTLFLLMAPLGFVGVLFQYLLATPDQKTSLTAIVLLMVGIGLVVLVAYFLARTRYYSQVARYTIGFATVAISLAVFLHPSPLNSETLLFYIIPIILAGTFLTFRQTTLYAVLNLVVMLLVVRADARLDFQQVLIGPFGIVILSSGILLLAYGYRNLLEQDRQTELSQREARYRGLLEAAFEAVVLHDGETILEHNIGFSRIFGYGSQIMDGNSILNFVDSTSQQAIKQLLVDGDSLPIEAIGLKKDGTSFYIEVISKITAHSGQHVKVLAVRDISGRKRIEQQLRVSLAEKDVLLKEIHHRVKNNLQVISSLLNLEAAKLLDPALLAQYQDSQNRIRSMAMIHEQLYRSEDLTGIEFGTYLHELTDSLMQSYQQASQGITIQVKAEAISLDIDMAIPCGLLVNELVSNALKHAFPDRREGLVLVTLRREIPDQIQLTIQDNGVGIPAEIDYQRASTLGLKLVNSLSQQLGATLELTNMLGAKFTIAFPYEK